MTKRRGAADGMAKARQVFASSFASPEERTAYYREMGKASQKKRITLTVAEAVALCRALHHPLDTEVYDENFSRALRKLESASES